MLRRALATACRPNGMLHTVLHRHRHWRQGGQLRCTFCLSAYNASANDPLGDVKDNPYFDKYSEKIRGKQQSSPAEFESRLKLVEEHKRQAQEDAIKAAEEMEKNVVGDKRLEKKKKLDHVLKLDLIKDKTADEITEIWNEYHKKKDVIYGVITKDEYEEIYQKSRQFPMFIYPLPRDMGYEFILQQWMNHETFFTPLIAYQAYQENAPPCLSITHYTELMEDKGIVLMVGEPDTKQLGLNESQLLALQIKLYYGQQSGLRFNLVRQFNNAPDSFHHMDLVKEFEAYKKDSHAAREDRVD